MIAQIKRLFGIKNRQLETYAEFDMADGSVLRVWRSAKKGAEFTSPDWHDVKVITDTWGADASGIDSRISNMPRVTCTSLLRNGRASIIYPDWH